MSKCANPECQKLALADSRFCGSCLQKEEDQKTKETCEICLERKPGDATFTPINYGGKSYSILICNACASRVTEQTYIRSTSGEFPVVTEKKLSREEVIEALRKDLRITPKETSIFRPESSVEIPQSTAVGMSEIPEEASPPEIELNPRIDPEESTNTQPDLDFPDSEESRSDLPPVPEEKKPSSVPEVPDEERPQAREYKAVKEERKPRNIEEDINTFRPDFIPRNKEETMNEEQNPQAEAPEAPASEETDAESKSGRKPSVVVISSHEEFYFFTDEEEESENSENFQDNAPPFSAGSAPSEMAVEADHDQCFRDAVIWILIGTAAAYILYFGFFAG